MTTKSKKRDPQFEELLRKTTTVDAIGNIRIKGMYASSFINFGFNGGIVSAPTSHVVWFLTHGRWPDEGLTVDHIDDDPMNNAPDNLQELTMEENQAKRRGRIVSRSYGLTRHGLGITVSQDKRDGRWYARRYLSRGETKTNKTVNFMLFGADSSEELDEKIDYYIEKGADEKALNRTRAHYPTYIRRKSKYGYGISVGKRPNGTYRAKRYDRDTKRYTDLFTAGSLASIENQIFQYVKRLEAAGERP